MKKGILLSGILSMVMIGSLPTTIAIASHSETSGNEISLLNNFEKEQSIEVVDFAYNWTHSAAIVRINGIDHIYVWGQNDLNWLGINGTSTVPFVTTPVDVTPNEWLSEDANIQMKDVENGWGSTGLLINNNGVDELYTWGRNADGEAGLGHKNMVYEPTKVEVPEWEGKEIVEIEFSKYMGSAIVRDENTDSLYTWGSHNKEWSSGGHGDIAGTEDILVPTKVNLYTDETHTTLYETNFRVIEYQNENTASLVVEEAISGEQKVFQWGRNTSDGYPVTFGETGSLKNSFVTLYDVLGMPVVNQAGPVIGDIIRYEISQTNGAFITEDDLGVQRLYMWGQGASMGYGGIGNESLEGPQGLTLIAMTGDEVENDEVFALGNSTIKDVDVSRSLSLVVITDEDGQDRMYSAGNNLNGQLGTGAGDDTWQTWTEVGAEEFAGKELVKIDTKSETVAVKVVDGDKETIYAWGFNAAGEIGNGDVVDLFTPYDISDIKAQESFNTNSVVDPKITMDSDDIKNETFDLSFTLTGRNGRYITQPNSYRTILESKLRFSWDGVNRVPNGWASNQDFGDYEIKIDENNNYYIDYSVEVHINNTPFGSYDSLYVWPDGDYTPTKIYDNTINFSNDYELTTTEVNFEDYDEEKGELKISFSLMDAFNNFNKDDMVIEVTRTKDNSSSQFRPQINVVETQTESTRLQQIEKTYVVEIYGIDNTYTYSNWSLSLTGNEDDLVTVDIVDSETGDVWFPAPVVDAGISLETMLLLLFILVIVLLSIQVGSSALLYNMIHSSNIKDLEEAEKLQYMAMTRKQIMELLVDQNVEFDRTAPKAALIELAWHHSKEEEEEFDENDYEHWKDFDFATLGTEELKEWLTEHNVEFDEKSSKEELADIANHFYHVVDR